MRFHGKTSARMARPFIVGLALAVTFGVVDSNCAAKTEAPIFTEPPAVVANPNPRVPLAAIARFATNTPVRTTIAVSDGEHEWTLDYDESHDPKAGLPVLGMRPNRRHTIRISIRDADGNVSEAPTTFEFTTPALPSAGDEFPPIEITVNKPEMMEPGFTLFSPRRRKIGDLEFGQSFGMLVAIDAAGEVVWYYRTDSRISDLERLRNGNIAYLTQDYRIVEIDMLGNEVTQWYATGRPDGPADGIPIETTATHHEIDELPSGNLVILGVEGRTVENYYTSDMDPNAPRKTQTVMGDQIIEFQRGGKVVWTWNAFDHLDPFRIGYNTFSGYWARRGFPNTADWTHANGLLYDERDDSLLVCMRIQCAILKVSRATGEIIWILGDDRGWPENLQDRVLKFEGETRGIFYQHAPVPTPHGTLLVFDNGIIQARPFDRPAPISGMHTRAVEFAIDERTMTAKEVWASESPGEDAVISGAMGDVDWLPETGNVLVHYGNLLPRDQMENITLANVLGFLGWSRIREYTHTTPPEVVWEAVLEDQSTEGKVEWSIYGGDRIASLIP